MHTISRLVKMSRRGVPREGARLGKCKSRRVKIDLYDRWTELKTLRNARNTIPRPSPGLFVQEYHTTIASCTTINVLEICGLPRSCTVVHGCGKVEKIGY